ncbi:hypothetical protein [Actinomadura sp. WMMA1423]|uniref:hypothetical protein n=1 Tax=Actinomadura sp. WMMA1423 TaxID=2591108 RepID=UPI00143DF4B0|nr:hypothetical protein [Actinomadura sp. WMMA1423]
MKAVYDQWSTLPNTAFRLLVYMALVSLDADDPPMFWGGRADLVAALGRELPDEDDESPEAALARQAAFKAVRDATNQLAKRGAICLVRAARGGRRQKWALNLRRSQVHENRADSGSGEEAADENRAPEGDENRAQRRTKNVQEVHEDRAPIEKEPRGDRRISQSARVREAVRWLRAEYGLTDTEAVTVWEIAESRAPEPVRYPVRYLQSMQRDPVSGEIKSDLADIVAAVQEASAPPLAAVPGPAAEPEPERPAPPVQPPILAAVQDDTDPADTAAEDGADTAEALLALREQLAAINQSRKREARAHIP